MARHKRPELQAWSPAIIIKTILVAIMFLSGCAAGRFQQVDTYMRQQNWPQARTLLEETTKSNPRDGDAHLLLAEVYGELEAGLEMQETLHQVREKFHSLRERADFLQQRFWVRYFKRGTSHFEDHVYNAAAHYFGLAVELDEDNKGSLERYGSALFLIGRYRQARDVYLHALTLDPDNATYKNNLAEIYFLNHEYGKTIELCNEILLTDSIDVNATKRRAYSYEALEKYDDAIRDFESVASLDPSAQLLTDFGLLYYGLQDYDNAVEQFEAATGFSEDNLLLYRHLGEANRLRHNYYEMARWFRRIVDTFPEDITGWKSLAIAYEALGQKEQLAQARHHIHRIADTN